MNVIIIHAHDAGRAVQPYGFPVHTPCVDTFAKENIFFRDAFCAAPTCSPSRAAMLTGMYPHEVDMLGLAHRGFSLNPVEKHLSAILKKLNYNTALAGIQHEVPHWEMLDYDEYVGEGPEASLSPGFKPLEWDTSIAAAVIQWLKKRPADDKPFYLFWGLFEPHRPFPETEDSFPFDTWPLKGIPDTEEIRKDLLGYKIGVEHTDTLIGEVLQTIKDQGLFDNSLIVITTDHGIAYPGYKCTLSDRGCGVEFIMKLPKALEAQGLKQVVVDEPVSHLDLLPTIFDLIGHRDDSLRGKTLLPLIRGQYSYETSFHDYLFSEISYHAAYEPVRGVRSRTHKLIRRFIKYPFLPSNIDNSSAKRILIGEEPEDGIYNFDEEYETFCHYTDELYDLINDPDENNNLMAKKLSSEQERIHAALETALNDWMLETKDPLSNGIVTPPGEALVSRHNAYSPKGLYLETRPDGGLK